MSRNNPQGPDFGVAERQFQQEQARRTTKLEDPSRARSFWPSTPPRSRIGGNDTASWYRQATAIKNHTGIRMVCAAGEIMDHR